MNESVGPIDRITKTFSVNKHQIFPVVNVKDGGQ